MRVIGFILILVLIVLGMHNGGNLTMVFDMGATLIVLGTTIEGFLMSAGPRTGVALGTIFSKGVPGDNLWAGRCAFQTARRGALAGGFVAAVAGVIMMLENLDDVGAIGPGMAMMVMGILWAVFLAYFVLHPLQAGIERRLIEAGEMEDVPSETALDLLVLGAGFLSCGIILVVLMTALGK